MSPAAFHVAILRSAALLVPRLQRTDWLAEWRSELWHVRRDPGGVSATAFCMGAFRDAFWLWSNGPTLQAPGILRLNLPATPAGIEDFPDQGVAALSSPTRCLSVLGALGAFCFVVALLLPAARHGLIYSPLAGNLIVLLAPANQNSASISRARFEELKAHSGGQLSGLAFYAPDGKENMSVARTSSDLFRLLNVPVARGNSGGLAPTSAAWRKWNLPGGVDTWRIEDESAMAAVPSDTEGFVVGRLRYTALQDTALRGGGFRLVRLQKRSPEFLGSLAIALFAGMLLGRMTSDFSEGHPRRIGPRRGLFLAAKTLLVVPIVIFGSLDLGSFGRTVSPLALHIAFISGLFAARWILADQRGRCPVCLRLLANPVRMGEPSRILLEWHGTELMCLRGHGMLYVPEWPALWSGRQHWMDLGPSWGGLFPAADLRGLSRIKPT